MKSIGSRSELSSRLYFTARRIARVETGRIHGTHHEKASGKRLEKLEFGQAAERPGTN
jgi:hypothetical protein